jgi:hypothetical protein
MASFYQGMIEADAPGYDPEQVEVYMRLKLGTLDHLDRDTFRAEVREACACIDASPDIARRLVRTYRPLGLGRL